MTNRPESLLSAKPPRPYHIAGIVVLKLKTSEFNLLTRSHTPGSPPVSCEELTNIAQSLRERVGLGPQQRFRLVGVASATSASPSMRLPSRLLLLNHKPLWVKRYVLCSVTARQPWLVAVFGMPSHG